MNFGWVVSYFSLLSQLCSYVDDPRLLGIKGDLDI